MYGADQGPRWVQGGRPGRGRSGANEPVLQYKFNIRNNGRITDRLANSVFRASHCICKETNQRNLVHYWLMSYPLQIHIQHHKTAYTQRIHIFIREKWSLSHVTHHEPADWWEKHCGLNRGCWLAEKAGVCSRAAVGNCELGWPVSTPLPYYTPVLFGMGSAETGRGLKARGYVFKEARSGYVISCHGSR